MQSGPSTAPSLNASQVGKDQTKANANAAISQSILNSTNQITPFGSLNYERTGGDYDYEGNFIPQWTATQTLTPQVQNLVNQGIDLSGKTFASAGGALDRINQTMGQALPDQTKFRDDAYKALMSRGSAELDRQEEAARTRLANQGVAIGSEASNRDLDTYGRARNDLTSQALINATGLAGQNIDQALTLRNVPFQDFSTLMGFTNIPQPSYMNTPQTGVNAADVTSPQLMAFDAASKSYQQAQANATATNNAIIGGLFGLGGAALGGAARRPSMFGLA